MPTWQDSAEELQQKLHTELGDRIWNEYIDTQNGYLRENVAFALFGLPDNVETGYSSEQLDAAKKMCGVIQGNGTNRGAPRTSVSVIYVIFHNDDHHAVPEAVFRIPRSEGRHIFIDRNRRVYKGWSDYKENNKLPEGQYCYPFLGVYSSWSDGRVCLGYGPTPAATLKQKALRAADKTATAVGVTSGVAMVASVFGPISPVILTAAQFAGVGARVYGAGRGAMTVKDRYKHNEAIGLGNSVARDALLNVVGGVLGVAGLGASRDVNGVEIGLLAKNGLDVFNLGVKLHAKYKFAGVGAGSYGARSAMTRIDRFEVEHKEEIGLGKSEARDTRLNIAGGVLGVAGLGASRGAEVSRSMYRAINGVKIGSLAKNVLCVVNLGVKLHAKYSKGVSAYSLKMAKPSIGRLSTSEGSVPLDQEVRTIETVDVPRSKISADDVTTLAKLMAVD